MSTNETLSLLFAHMANLYDLRGEEQDDFRSKTYRQVAQRLKYLQKPIETLVVENELATLPGFGQATIEKITEYVTSGKLKAYTELKGSFPESLLKLMDIPSLGPKKVHKLWKQLGITNTTQLKVAIEAGHVEELEGFGPKSVQNILQGIEIKKTLVGRTLLGHIFPLVKELQAYIAKHPDVEKLEPAGSFRRREITVGDVDFLATVKGNAKPLIDYFCAFPRVQKVLAQGDTKGSIILSEGKQIDLRVVHPEEWGAALQYFTGSKDHNVVTRGLAKSKGLKINEYGVFKIKNNERIAAKSEVDVYNSFGLHFIPPELRTNTGEVEFAMRQKFPRLVEISDIQGDLHTHTTWSDGSNFVDEMCSAAMTSGLQYLALTDHSPSLVIAKGLKVVDVKKRQVEIEKAQSKVKGRLTILSGTEVDIKTDGSLDYPNAVLSGFDIVVASIHSGFTKDNTSRLCRAMEHPSVNVIGHLTGRQLGSRKAYPVNFEAVFRQAVKTNTWIEINAQPDRLDCPWEEIKKGRDMGVKFVISSDAHSVDSLWFLELGVSMARKGWLSAEHIVNTLSTEKLMIELARKKTR